MRVRVKFCPLFSCIRNCIAFSKGYQASGTCPSDKSSINVNMSTEHWWNDRYEKTNVFGKKICPCVTLPDTNNIACTEQGSNPGSAARAPRLTSLNHDAAHEYCCISELHVTCHILYSAYNTMHYM